MTIKETIKTVVGPVKEGELMAKLNKWIELGAPPSLIAKAQAEFDTFRRGDMKIKGMARKHQVGDVEVLDYQVAGTYGFYFAGSYRKKQTTKVIKMVTANETYYYDLTDNKIGTDTEMVPSLAGLFPR